MNAIWLIERGVFRPYESELLAEIEFQSVEGYFVDYVPGKDPPNEIIGYSGRGSNIVFVGSHPMMHQIVRHRDWIPGGWCNFHNLRCSTYYAYFKSFLLNTPFRIVRGLDAAKQQNQLFSEFGGEDELFVRPDSVEKVFPGAVVHAENFQPAISSSRFDPDSRIVVASPREIGREWRVVVAGDSVIAASQYRSSGAILSKEGCPAKVRLFCEKVLSEVQWRPDPMFMMDICESNDRLYVLELNSFSCSGFYRCDLRAIVSAATELAERIGFDKNR